MLALLAASTLAMSGCGAGNGVARTTGNSGSNAAAAETSGTGAGSAVSEAASLSGAKKTESADQAAADHVADLIDTIYVKERTEDTDKQCKEAKAAWDALTDTQKQLVNGEFADPDYFGRDTGDASKDDPLNQDGIGENELLVVSFGTSFNDSRTADIGGIEKALQEAFAGWSVRRAFTSQIIINHVEARDSECIDNVEQALERAVKNGVPNLVVQPTHLMHGAEYDELVEAVDKYRDKFKTIQVAEPLLGEVGADGTVVNQDKEAVARAITDTAVKAAGYDRLDQAAQDGTAFVFMGHGTSHQAAVTYDQMQTQMQALGYVNIYIGTVEGKPVDTSCESVIKKVKDAGYKKVVLRPLMVVAGDHANNDMAGDDADSWQSQFQAANAFDSVTSQIAGLGEIPEVQQIYVSHAREAVNAVSGSNGNTDSAAATASLEDGTYSADFKTDSAMFHVNEALNGKGTLTVKDGKMTIHVSLTSENIVNLFPGTAEDAQKPGAALLQPVKDTVKYSDGTTETVNGFDIPVPAIGEDFDCALLGTKGKWYDHKVNVTNPVKQ